MKKLILLFLPIVMVACKMPPRLDNDYFPEQADLMRDEAVHPKNSLEWWYATGWLQDDVTGDTFGIEFVIFHFNLVGKKDRLLTNVAITDPNTGTFYFDHGFQKKKEPMQASLPLNLQVHTRKVSGSLAGQHGDYLINGHGRSDGVDFGYSLRTESSMPVVFHGGGSGIENYGGHARAGYFSYTRLATKGVISIAGENRKVSGELWYDRQWNCGEVMQQRTTGWDWMSVNIEETGEQMMVYRLRLKKGGNVFGGTLIKADGSYSQIPPDSIIIEDESYWKSPSSRDRYPLNLSVKMENGETDLNITAVVNDQELAIKVLPGLGMHYWEGMCNVSGTRNGKEVTGSAYLEITNPENNR